MFTNRPFNAFAGLNTGSQSIQNSVGSIVTATSGNVGIGVANPNSLLHVNGNINTSSLRTIDLKNTNITCTNFTSINLITTNITCQNITSVNLIVPNTTINNLNCTNLRSTNLTSSNILTSSAIGINITTSSLNITNFTTTNMTSTNVISTNTSTINISNQTCRANNITANNFIGIGTVNTGTILLWPSNSIPSDYILCNGAEISRTIYSALFNAIQTTYGAGNGSTTFNVPDLRGRVPMGRPSDYSLGYTFGSERVTLTETQMPSHNHGGLTSTVGDHSHTYKRTQLNGDNQFPQGFYSESFFIPENRRLTNSARTTNEAGFHTHNVGFVGGGQSHENMQPFIALNFVIKT